MKTILFFGDSLTSGHGLLNPDDAFPGLIQLKIDSLKLPYKIINAGLSGEITAEGKERIDSLLKQKIDICNLVFYITSDQLQPCMTICYVMCTYICLHFMYCNLRFKC